MLALILMFSFYFTHRSALLLRNNDPIMQNIMEYSKEMNVNYVNAQIDDNYIIPGLYGKKINELKSLMKMKSERVFNSLFLVTDYIKPQISLDDHKDKVISKGNVSKNAISLILENDESNYITYLKSNNIEADLLVKKETVNYNDYFEQINNDFNNYSEVEKKLGKQNTNLCLLSRNNKDFCIRNKKYLIEPTYTFTSSNLIAVKNKISSGDIILVKDSVTSDDMSYLIEYIKSRGLNIIKLSKLISEK